MIHARLLTVNSLPLATPRRFHASSGKLRSSRRVVVRTADSSSERSARVRWSAPDSAA